MEKYENIEIVGEGSYGIVMKCMHKETGQIVAIKKFLESMDNLYVRNLALREIRMLKKLRHENLISLIEVFRHKKNFYLVFEYLDHTILNELETVGSGLGFEISRRHIFQVLRGLNFCHNNYIMHRDVKPENVLVSARGVIKICDFGFARIITGSNESCTDYVATRWYRAPELLVGESHYGAAIDTWAVGCLFAEMLTGEPLFPGDSDLDQLFRITRTLGSLCLRHQQLISRGLNARVMRQAGIAGDTGGGARRALRGFITNCGSAGLDFIGQCLRMDPDSRPGCSILLQHVLFQQDCFAERFLDEVCKHLVKNACEKPTTRYACEEGRRLSLLSLNKGPQLYSGENTRWHMNVIRDKELKTNKLAKAAQFQNFLQLDNAQQNLHHSRSFHLPKPKNVSINEIFMPQLVGKDIMSSVEAHHDEEVHVLPVLALSKNLQHQQQYVHQHYHQQQQQQQQT